MPSQVSLPSAIVEGRKRLAEAREKLAASHESGTPGPQVAAAMTSVVDEILGSLCQVAVQQCRVADELDDFALVAHGGYGRRDLAPYSDLDVMLLVRWSAANRLKGLARRISQDIVDCGFDLGFATRTPHETRVLAWRDPIILTSLSESRFLYGNEDFFETYLDRLRIGGIRRQSRLIEFVRVARREERARWGETPYLLRPNVKRSRGGQRDIQLVRWVGFLKYGETDLSKLAHLGAITEQDYARLRDANSFLVRLRNHLHFRTGKAQDVLDRALQVEIAERWNYRGAPGILPVEQFMQDYFRHVSNVRYASSNFVDSVRHRSLSSVVFDRLFAKQVDHEFLVGPYHIRVRPESLPRIADDLAAVLRLMELANQHDKRIDNSTWQAIRTAMAQRPARLPDEIVAGIFMQFLRRTGRLGSLLRRLHEVQVLEQIIPAMAHARNLLQFNEYHKYTVDTHTFRAVEAAAAFEESECLAGRVYRRLKKPELLHLALLLHDLGKGFTEDHSEVGRRIALETGEILRLPPRDTELIATLIHKHLLMANTAFRHDVNDSAIISKFASQVGSQRLLDMLFLHTIADMTAVGPDVLTDWKRTWLDTLYRNTRAYFRGSGLPGDTVSADAHARTEIRKLLRTSNVDDEILRWADEVPDSAILGKEPVRVVEEIKSAAPVARGEMAAIAWGTYDAENDTSDYTIVCRQDRVKIGLFARIVSALSASNLEILRAEIDTVSDDVAWDRFTVQDPDFGGQPPEAHYRKVCERIVKSIEAEDIPKPHIRQVWRAGEAAAAVKVEELPPQVQVDNDTSSRFTIFSLFTYDRPRLLFDIAHVLASANVDLQFAKIATHVDQVVDVFYVTRAEGGQIVDDTQIQDLCEKLVEACRTRDDSSRFSGV